MATRLLYTLILFIKLWLSFRPTYLAVKAANNI